MIIYKTTNIINGLIYIGQHGVGHHRSFIKPEKRYKGGGSKLRKEGFKVFGFKNFIRDTLEEFEYTSDTDANKLEDFWIDFFNATNPEIGYNIRRKNGGGRGSGWKASEKTRKKLSEKNKGEKNGFYGKHHNETTIALLSKISKNQPHPKGQKRTDEQKKNMSLAHIGKAPGNKGKPMSKEQKEKISIAGKGRKQSEETKIKRANSLRGKKRGPQSQKTKDKISETLKNRNKNK